jgi:hypothetical protein
MALTDAALVPLQQSGGGAGIIVFWVVYLAVLAVVIAGMWKTFEKANQPGWAAIIPIYNVYILTKIGGLAWWYLLLLFVPIVQLYAAYKISRGVAEAFGQGLGFALGLWFLGFIFYPLLGFGDYSYQGTP